MSRQTLLALVFTLSWATLSHASAPQVVSASPDNGEIDVASDVKQIRIEFDQRMDAGGRSIVGGGDAFPEITGELKWLDDKMLVIPVSLKPDHQYQFGINSDTFKGFRSKTGEAADWYPVRFKTRAAGAAPAPSDVTLEQNKRALAILERAIDEDFAARNLRNINWAQEIASRRAAFENAPSSNAFARLTAHLLQLAHDGHVSVQAGDVRIWTSVNSTPPNFNVGTLQRIVPAWNARANGIITGRFDNTPTDGGIGYIHFAQCSKQQADNFDPALDELKDTKALILDARYTGGGNEFEAQRVAGRFVEKPAVYSIDRIRQGGKWKPPYERIIQPRTNAARYTKPVVVLVGPKVTSSAESFILMMREGAKAKLIGDLTGGSSGLPVPHDLGNGVTVYLTSWEDRTPEGAPIEAHGVQPDILIHVPLRDFEKSDPVLEAALKYLRSVKFSSTPSTTR